MSRSKGPRPVWEDRSKEGKSSQWVIRDGQIKRRTGIAHSPRKPPPEVEKILKDYIASKWTPPKGLGQQVLIDEVIAAYRQDNVDAHSYENFIVPTSNPLLEWWSGKKLSDVNKKTCNDYVEWRKPQDRKFHPNSKVKRRVKLSSIRHELKTLRAAINHYKAAVDTQLVVPKVTVPKAPPPRKNYYLEKDEAYRLLHKARKNPDWRHLVRFILVGLRQGRRPGAILSLRWTPSEEYGWVDVDRRLIFWAAEGETETNKRKTTQRIHSHLLPQLKVWKAQDMAKGIDAVVHYEGESIETSIKKSWKALTEGLCENKKPHVLRHTCATWMVSDPESNLSTAEIAAWLAMSEKTLVETYGHHMPTYQDRASQTVFRPKNQRRKVG